MFAKLFVLLACVAAAMALPAPAPAAKPDPQVLAYTAGVDYVAPVAYSAYSAPAYSPYVAAAPAAAVAYSAPVAYPAYYVR